jgi:hypothetical protein
VSEESFERKPQMTTLFAQIPTTSEAAYQAAGSVAAPNSPQGRRDAGWTD